MNRNIKKIGAVFLAAVLVSFTLLFPAAAADTGVSSPENKIDPALLVQMNVKENGETIPVSVWFKDIDQDSVSRQVQDTLRQKLQNGGLAEETLLLNQYNTAAALQARTMPAVLGDEEKAQLSTLSAEDTQTYIETQRAVASQKYQEQNTKKFNALFPKEKQGFFRSVSQEQPEVLYACRYAPNILMELTKEQIDQVACSDVVEGIYYCDEMQQDPFPTQEKASQPSTAAAAAGNISLTYQTITGASDMRIYNHATGKGVKIGQIELSVPNFDYSFFDHMRDTAHPDNNKFHILMDVSRADVDKGHETNVAAIMVGKSEGFTGIAPDAEYYAVGVYDGATHAKYWRKGMELLLDAGVNVINASYEFDSVNRTCQYTEPSKWIDHVINAHNVSVCISSGNDRGILNGAMAYNAVTVGNIDDKHTNTMSDDKRYYENEIKQSQFSTNPSLAYKPDIMAPGATAGIPNDPQNGTNHGGTSYSAPIVSAIIAQLCEKFPAYKAMPLLLKAALLAGAVKTQEMIDCDEDVDPDNDIDSVKYGDRIALDRKNGAGMVNVLRAAAVFYDGTFFYHPSFGKTSSLYAQNVQLDEDSRMQICLVWPKENMVNGPHYPPDGTSNPPTPATDVAKETLLLSVYDNRPMMIYESYYQKDTKEYIAYTPTKPGQFSIQVSKISNPYITGVPMYLAWSQQ